jgi:hypothetical protein
VENYNSAVGSLETRVLTTARRFEELKAAPESASIPNLEPIDKSPRDLQPAAAAPAPLSFTSDDAEDMLAPPESDDFTFVPDPPASARNAASDLRSALE